MPSAFQSSLGLSGLQGQQHNNWGQTQPLVDPTWRTDLQKIGPLGIGFDASEQEAHDFFFGPPTAYVKSPARSSAQEYYNFTDAYSKPSPVMSCIIIRNLVAMDVVWTTSILPVVVTDSMTLDWDEWRFEDTTMDSLAEEAPPRTMVSQRSARSSRMKRYGKGVRVGHEFWRTAQGQMHYDKSFQQMNNSVIECANLAVARAIVDSRPLPGVYNDEVVDSPLTMLTFSKALEATKNHFGIIHKKTEGIITAYKHIKRTLADRGVSDFLTVIPAGSGDYIEDRPEYSGSYPSISGLPLGTVADPIRNGRIGRTIESRKFHLGVDHPGASADVFFHQVAIGEWFHMKCPGIETIPLNKYETRMRTLAPYDEDVDTFVPITLTAAMTASGLFKIPSGMGDDGGDSYDDDVDAHGSPKDALTDWFDRDNDSGKKKPQRHGLTALGRQYFGRYRSYLHLFQDLPGMADAFINRLESLGSKVTEDLKAMLGPVGHTATGVRGSGGGGLDNKHTDGDSESAKGSLNVDLATFGTDQLNARFHTMPRRARAVLSERVQAFLEKCEEAPDFGRYIDMFHELAGRFHNVERFDVIFITFVKVIAAFIMLGKESAAARLVNAVSSTSAPNNALELIVDSVLADSEIDHWEGFDVRAIEEIIQQNVTKIPGLLKRVEDAFYKKQRLDADKADSTSREGIRQLLSLPITCGDFFFWCAENDLPVPLSFVLHRPYQRYNMGDMVGIKPGAETGNLFMGHPFTSIGNDPLQRMHVVNFSVYMKALIVNPENIAVAKNVYCNQYYGGTGTQFWYHTNEDYERVAAGLGNTQEQTPSLFSCVVPADWTRHRPHLDITGRHDPTVVDEPQYCNADESGERSCDRQNDAFYTNLHYPTAKLYSNVWGWHHGQEPISKQGLDVVDRICGRMAIANTLCFRGAHLRYDFNSNEMRFEEGQGHWGPDAHPGIKAERVGEASCISSTDQYGKGRRPNDRIN